MHDNAQKRVDILKTLYMARESKPTNGWVSGHDLKNAHGNIAFALDVLTETQSVVQDGYKYRITGTGVLLAEEHGV
ncbi:MAG: hypothetical protein RIR18_2467 [Pseudomonadota bacterium]|jgi:predicted transcriptional regulator